MTWFAVAVSAAIFTFIGASLLCRALPKLGLVAIPNTRSSHSCPTVTGVGVVVPVMVSIATLAVLGYLPPLVAVALAMAALGFLEDLYELPPPVRLLVQMLIAVTGIIFVGLPWWLVTPAALAVVATVNGLNFMDGINGITTTQGVVFGLVLLTAALISSSEIWAIVGLLVASSCLGYLPNNFPQAKSFPGDVLPYFLGTLFTLGLLDMSTGSAPLLLGIGALMPAAVDTAGTLIRRMRNGERLTVAHRDHAYQRLARATSHSVATARYLMLTILGALGLVAAEVGGDTTIGILWVLLSCLCTIVVLFVFQIHHHAPAGNHTAPD